MAEADGCQLTKLSPLSLHQMAGFLEEHPDWSPALRDEEAVVFGFYCTGAQQLFTLQEIAHVINGDGQDLIPNMG